MLRQKSIEKNNSQQDITEGEEILTKKNKDELIFMAADVWGISGVPLDKVKRFYKPMNFAGKSDF